EPVRLGSLPPAEHLSAALHRPRVAPSRLPLNPVPPFRRHAMAPPLRYPAPSFRRGIAVVGLLLLGVMVGQASITARPRAPPPNASVLGSLSPPGAGTTPARPVFLKDTLTHDLVVGYKIQDNAAHTESFSLQFEQAKVQYFPSQTGSPTPPPTPLPFCWNTPQ